MSKFQNLLRSFLVSPQPSNSFDPLRGFAQIGFGNYSNMRCYVSTNTKGFWFIIWGGYKGGKVFDKSRPVTYAAKSKCPPNTLLGRTGDRKALDLIGFPQDHAITCFWASRRSHVLFDEADIYEAERMALSQNPHFRTSSVQSFFHQLVSNIRFIESANRCLERDGDLDNLDSEYGKG